MPGSISAQFIKPCVDINNISVSSRRGNSSSSSNSSLGNSSSCNSSLGISSLGISSSINSSLGNSFCETSLGFLVVT